MGKTFVHGHYRRRPLETRLTVVFYTVFTVVLLASVFAGVASLN